MKIWIDARICDEGWYYGDFVCELVEAFCRENSKHKIIVYTKKNLPLTRRSLLNDFKTRKIYEKEKFALMIFFDHHIPHGYKGEYIVLIESLKEVFFPKNQWLHRKIYSYKLKKAIGKSQKVLVLDGGSALELNERLNVVEDRIEKIHGFFPVYQNTSHSPITVDVKTKHNLRWDYLIYDSGNEVHNNFERILKTLMKLKDSGIMLYIVILCEATIKDLDIRAKAIEYSIADQILFLWDIWVENEASYYGQSLGVIFSSIYESFPFHFSKAIAYNCHIFANEIPANKDVMWETISYMDPLSIYNIRDAIDRYIKKPKKADYSKILEKYNAKNTALEMEKQVFIKN